MFFSKLKSRYLYYWLGTLSFFSPRVVKSLFSKPDVIPRLLANLFLVSVIAFVVFSLNFYVTLLIKAIGRRLQGM